MGDGVVVSIFSKNILLKKHIKSEPFETTLETLQHRAQQILFVITNCPASHRYLWPYLLQFITNSIFAPGLATICKTIGLIIEKFNERESGTILTLDSTKNGKLTQNKTFARKFNILSQSTPQRPRVS
jgi:hypothetical protein